MLLIFFCVKSFFANIVPLLFFIISSINFCHLSVIIINHFWKKKSINFFFVEKFHHHHNLIVIIYLSIVTFAFFPHCCSVYFNFIVILIFDFFFFDEKINHFEQKKNTVLSFMNDPIFFVSNFRMHSHWSIFFCLFVRF